jgi:hypothetical protein
MSGRVQLLLALPAVVALSVSSGCEQTFRDMYDQPRYKPLARSDLWSDGRASRPQVDGSVPQSRGTFAGASSGRAQQLAADPAVPALEALRDDVRDTIRTGSSTSFSLPPVTPQLLARGHERFDIFCAPCHSVVGDGDGMVARRGFPHPPSFHTDRLRSASDAHFYAVITYGYGAMYSYATRVEPADRIAIVAYIRALQLSQHAPVARLSDHDRAQLLGAAK